MASNLNHVLSLVRYETERTPSFGNAFPLDKKRTRVLIRAASRLIRRACEAPPEALNALCNEATVRSWRK